MEDAFDDVWRRGHKRPAVLSNLWPPRPSLNRTLCPCWQSGLLRATVAGTFKEQFSLSPLYCSRPGLADQRPSLLRRTKTSRKDSNRKTRQGWLEIAFRVSVQSARPELAARMVHGRE